MVLQAVHCLWLPVRRHGDKRAGALFQPLWLLPRRHQESRAGRSYCCVIPEELSSVSGREALQLPHWETYTKDSVPPATHLFLWTGTGAASQIRSFLCLGSVKFSFLLEYFLLIPLPLRKKKEIYPILPLFLVLFYCVTLPLAYKVSL